MLKNTIIVSFIGLALGLSACGGKKDSHEGHDHAKKEITEEKLVYFTCPMESHKHVYSREEGSCLECGMKLVAGVLTSEEKKDYYGCPMLIHSHVRSDKPGKCDECGMKLMPLRLKES